MCDDVKRETILIRFENTYLSGSAQGDIVYHYIDGIKQINIFNMSDLINENLNE
jgi:hypothetical protein